MRFYYISNNEQIIESDDSDPFIDIYSKLYFIIVPYEFEIRTMKLLNKEVYSMDDALQLMRWKLGDYKGKLCNGNVLRIPRTNINLVEEEWQIITNAKSMHENGVDEKEIFHEVTRIQGIGTIYALTILFFVSGVIGPISTSKRRILLY